MIRDGAAAPADRQAPAARPIDDPVARLDLDRKVRLLTGADLWRLHGEPAAGLRPMVVSDGPAGVRGERWDDRDPSINVPSPTALAATWDEGRLAEIGLLLAAEARRKGVDVLLAPAVNIQRSPYSGRHFECFSEDPLLTARMGAALVRGVQSGGVAATVKHFVGNDSETGRMGYDARIDERTLREVYLLPFEVIVREAGAWAVMASYNSVNGDPMTESPLLREVLQREWGFDGLTMSDWFATRSTEATAAAGLDLAMPGPHGPWGEALAAAVRAGAIHEAVVDDKVRRLLRLAARVGALAGHPAPPAPPVPGPARVAATLRAAAAASFVLAANDGLLPLPAGSLRRVALLGAHAAAPRALGGGSATVFPHYTVSPLDGLRAALPGAEIVHEAGVRVSDRLPVAGPPHLRRPDGAPGATVRFLSATGAALGAEDRDTGLFTWLNHYGTPRDREVAAVEVTTLVQAGPAGTYTVGFSGLGRYRLAVNGAEVADTVLAVPPGTDMLRAVMVPPQHGHRVHLGAGERMEVRLRHDVAAGGPGTVFGLNLATPDDGDDAAIERAVAAARAAELAVVVVGTTEELECEGLDRDTLALPGRQDELVARVAAANPRTVAVVNAGAPVLLPWAEKVAAVLLTWFPGQEFGHALGDVLTGRAEPGGRLPMTWPAGEQGLAGTVPVDGVLRYAEGLRVGYRDGRTGRYPFGHGLGYTTWAFGAAAAAAAPGGGAVVSVPVRNTGDRPGRQVVQVYLDRAGGSVDRPVRWLAGFGTVHAGPGEEVTVRVELPRRAFAHWDTGAGAWAVEPGRYGVEVGASSADLPSRAEFHHGG
ncbi:beta-glucosidase [Sphaerisporangium rufum]|uniref:Beta-glucosidase n=1 Tax=Sphaerisporangium rufum TaxID=1381558 RepID=A0A919V3W6_9ACTN|nr:glycoside hydrolase family 3 C-terminal domain-containing protein [Sphaerisporangium rufum]GII76680.1 beta-glucosidase [Sphaerisporangium rufum]